MGNIGRRQQRFEVLPEPAWSIEDVLAGWRDTAPVSEPVAEDYAERTDVSRPARSDTSASRER